MSHSLGRKRLTLSLLTNKKPGYRATILVLKTFGCTFSGSLIALVIHVPRLVKDSQSAHRKAAK